MKIRSVTIFNGHPNARDTEELARAGTTAQTCRKRLEEAGFEVQTTRLALAPAYTWMPALDTVKSIGAARELEKRATESGIDYVSLGPVANCPERVDQILKLPELIANTQSIFASVPMADGSGFNWTFEPIARAVKEIANSTENGFGNLRFAALAECPAGIPFFPAAYAAKNDFSCALAIECADLALTALNETTSVHDAMRALENAISKNADRIERALDGIEIPFRGCDWSLAPHPDAACSIGATIERMSGAPFGEWGTLSAVASLTRAIRNAHARRVGFSGVFLPLLEDAVLAKRTRSIADLQTMLLYCSVCGSGLDTIPLPGDVATESIAALLMDVATLATTLHKPLTARLMPIPGLKAGDSTHFDFPFLVNGQTLPLNGGGTLQRLPRQFEG